jgi:lipoate-protein ligase B
MTSWLKSSETIIEALHLPLGHAEYVATHRLQERLHRLRCRNEIPDTILTVEHNPVFTIGRSGSAENILVPEQVLKNAGISVHRIERGGDITYHGPGQLVVYPIVDLRVHGRDLKRYVSNLEQAVINFLEKIGVKARRRTGFPGVWVNSYKIASVGVYVKHWVTRHGLALNVDINKAHFAMINPCGLEIEVLSLADLVSECPSMEEVATGLLAELRTLCRWHLTVGDPQEYRGERHA